MTKMMIIWLIVLVVMMVYEIISLGLTSIWFAGGALIALVLAVLKLPIWLQIAVFIVASILLLVITRPIAKKYLNKHVTRTNAESLIGQRAVVSKDIDNLMGTGEVTVNGMPWTARASEEGQKIPVDTVVVVMEIQGVKLIVKKVEH